MNNSLNDAVSAYIDAIEAYYKAKLNEMTTENTEKIALYDATNAGAIEGKNEAQRAANFFELERGICIKTMEAKETAAQTRVEYEIARVAYGYERFLLELKKEEDDITIP